MSRNRLGKLLAKLTPAERRELLKAAFDRGDVEEIIRLKASGIYRTVDELANLSPDDFRRQLLSDLFTWKSMILQPSPEVLAALQKIADSPEAEMERARLANLSQANSDDSFDDDSTPTDLDLECYWLHLHTQRDQMLPSEFEFRERTPRSILNFILRFPQFKRIVGESAFQRFMDAPWGTSADYRKSDLGVDLDDLSTSIDNRPDTCT